MARVNELIIELDAVLLCCFNAKKVMANSKGWRSTTGAGFRSSLVKGLEYLAEYDKELTTLYQLNAIHYEKWKDLIESDSIKDQTKDNQKCGVRWLYKSLGIDCHVKEYGEMGYLRCTLLNVISAAIYQDVIKKKVSESTAWERLKVMRAFVGYLRAKSTKCNIEDINREVIEDYLKHKHGEGNTEKAIKNKMVQFRWLASTFAIEGALEDDNQYYIDLLESEGKQ